jgi:hypothetical protein
LFAGTLGAGASCFFLFGGGVFFVAFRRFFPAGGLSFFLARFTSFLLYGFGGCLGGFSRFDLCAALQSDFLPWSAAKHPEELVAPEHRCAGVGKPEG